jgi:hypothetical protein
VAQLADNPQWAAALGAFLGARLCWAGVPLVLLADAAVWAALEANEGAATAADVHLGGNGDLLWLRDAYARGARFPAARPARREVLSPAGRTGRAGRPAVGGGGAGVGGGAGGVGVGLCVLELAAAACTYRPFRDDSRAGACAAPRPARPGAERAGGRGAWCRGGRRRSRCLGLGPTMATRTPSRTPSTSRPRRPRAAARFRPTASPPRSASTPFRGLACACRPARRS